MIALVANVSTSASKCMLSDGETSVEDAIDELTGSKSGGTITLSTTPYETEADGYLWIYMVTPNKLYSVTVKANDGTQVAALRGQTVTSYEYHSLYVKKGMKIAYESEQSLSDGEMVYFKPLTD